MGHTSREKTKLLNRVRRIRGQVEAIERALDGEGECVEVLQLIAAARGAMNGLMVEVMEGHVREHVVGAGAISDAERQAGAEELIGVIRSYIK